MRHNINNNTATIKDGQAPARRIGIIIAVIITCIGCACLGGLWYLVAREGVDTLMKSVSLAASGATTTGTVTSVEEFSSGRANFPSTSYKLTVSFEADGSTYSVTSNAYYKPIDKSWVGESMPIIYDPDRFISGTLAQAHPQLGAITVSGTFLGGDSSKSARSLITVCDGR